MASPLRQRAHYLVERRLGLEADAGEVGQADEASLDRAIVGEAAERREHVGVGFVAAEPEPDRDVERKLVAAMRHASAYSIASSSEKRRLASTARLPPSPTTASAASMRRRSSAKFTPPILILMQA